MSVIRIKKRDNPFAQIDRGILQDQRLSYQAIGLAAYLMSKPNDWKVRIKDLIKPAIDGNKRPVNGGTSVRSALKELRREGYARLVINRNSETGEVCGKSWEVSETKIFDTDNQQVTPTCRKTRRGEKTDVGKTPTTSNNDTSIEVSKKGIYSFDDFWDDYGLKRGKAKCKKKWDGLTDKEKQKIKETLPAYISETCIKESAKSWKPRRKYPLTYLNGEVWLDYEDRLKDKKDTSDLSESQKQAYDKYLNWLEKNYSDAIESVAYLSAAQFKKYYELKAHMTNQLKFTYLNMAHRAWRMDGDKEIFDVFMAKIDEYKKQMA